MNKISESIIQSIRKNGFPEKKVTLPFQAIYDSCKKNDLKLSDVLKTLAEEDIQSEIGNDKILFFKKSESAAVEPDMNDNSIFKAAMDKIKGLDPKELASLKDKVMNMSEEERSALLGKAKDFFKKK
ncbi:MAG: hypothetical protein HOD92_23340 [Deltaproteobacteria bacterium]|jgi:hypothetical protein|nr:hypothetical protein [Deltaproteobacteria bacterium]MBT4524976.1 hypothetical protein [Deltaproteobacteria bacterium]